MKIVGFGGMDRSGSKATAYSVISLIHAKKKATIHLCEDEIRKIAIKISKVFVVRDEIKSKHFKDHGQRRSVMKKFEENDVNFHSVIISGRDISTLFKKYRHSWKCKVKTEAVLWFACIESFSKKFRIIPRVIFIDEMFPEEDQELFESFICTLCKKCLEFVPAVETVNSKFEASVRLADFVSGFIRVDSRIKATYTKNVEKLSIKKIERLWKCLESNPHSDMVVQHRLVPMQVGLII